MPFRYRKNSKRFMMNVIYLTVLYKTGKTSVMSETLKEKGQSNCTVKITSDSSAQMFKLVSLF